MDRIENQVLFQSAKLKTTAVNPFLASALFILFLSVRAFACECSEIGAVDEQFAVASDVVIMKATSNLEPPRKDSEGYESVSGFNFTVEKVYKGGLKVGQEFPVVSTGMCGFGFNPADLGEKFLFYYYNQKDNDRFSIVPMCTRSGRAKWRATDISWLDNINKVRGLTRISGIISQFVDSAIEDGATSSFPLKDHTVRITGNGRDIRLRTDENGVYEIYGLPSGQYRVAPEVVKGYMPTNSIRTRTDFAVINIGGRLNGEANFDFEIDNRIRGRVFDSDGKPLANARLELIPAAGKPRRYFVKTDYSEKDGTFEFDSIPAGTYVVVGNSRNEVTAENPYPRYYSSGAADRTSATEITIGPGDVLDGFTVKAPRPAKVVPIPGTILFADGTLAAGTIRFVTGDGETRQPGDAYAYSDNKGKFLLKVLKGQKGYIYAYVPPNQWTYRDCKARLTSPEALASKGKDGFLESSRRQIEITGDMSPIEIRLPFNLCAAR